MADDGIPTTFWSRVGPVQPKVGYLRFIGFGVQDDRGEHDVGVSLHWHEGHRLELPPRKES